MTVTYTEDRIIPFADQTGANGGDDFVPVYARTGRKTRRGDGKVKAWMILAPIGAVVLGGAAAAMLMSGGDEVAQPVLAESAATAPVVSVAPALVPPAATTSAPTEMASVPIIRESPPAPARRAAARSEAPVVAPRVVEAPAVTPSPAIDPSPASPTAMLNTAPSAAPAPAQPNAPAITVEPLG